MKQCVILFIAILCFGKSLSQEQNVKSGDSLLLRQDTVKSIFLQTYPPTLSPIKLSHYNAPLGNKILRGFGYSIGLNLTLAIFLLIAPDNITMWGRSDKFQLSVIRTQYINTFTKPPVIDRDLWSVNYVGHPYQGAYYYNTMRSQGADMLESAAFCFAQSCLWEYVWEGGMEQSSIQDLIVTPVLGSVVGELSHIATVKIGENDYTWYEKVIVCIINPSYALNNRFKVKHLPNP
jgi:hypothetical protein